MHIKLCRFRSIDEHTYQCDIRSFRGDLSELFLVSVPSSVSGECTTPSCVRKHRLAWNMSLYNTRYVTGTVNVLLERSVMDINDVSNKITTFLRISFS